MAQKYYADGTTTSSAPFTGAPTTSQSAVFPAAQNNDAAFTPFFCAIATSRDNGGETIGAISGQTGTFSSAATTTTQSTFVGYGWIRVGAATFGSGTWNAAVEHTESNGAANVKYGLSVYVYRVGSGVVGYIYDSLTQLATEATSSLLYHTASFTGANVTSLNGDYLIWEIHHVATQSMGTAYTVETGVRSVSATDATDGSDGTTTTGWVEAPAAFPTYSAAAASAPFSPNAYRPQFTRPRRRMV